MVYNQNLRLTWPETYQEMNAKGRISKIKAPTLIFVGDKDSVTPVEMSKFLSGEIKGPKLQR